MAGNPFLAMITLAGTEAPPLDSISDSLRTSWPDSPSFSDVTERGPLTTFHFGSIAVALSHIPQPMAWKYLEGPAACAWYWPEAATRLRGHRTHLILHLLDPDAKPLERATALTQLTAASVSACTADHAVGEPSGVLWGPGRLVHPAPAFVELAQQMDPTELPLYLWIDFRVEAEESGALRLFTTGLEALGQLEIEVTAFRGDVGDLRATVYNVAHYALLSKKSINQGQFLGTDEEHKVIANYCPSLVDPNQEVLRLEFES